jgi:hypothetical protein
MTEWVRRDAQIENWSYAFEDAPHKTVMRAPSRITSRILALLWPEDVL